MNDLQFPCIFMLSNGIHHGDTFASQAWMASLFGYASCVAKESAMGSLSFTG